MTASDVIPLANPRADLVSLQEELLEAAARVLARGNYILGASVQDFETRMADRLDALGAVGVASGTDALILALLTVGAGPSDEVITVSHTAGPTVAAIHTVGATPVLVEIDPNTYCIDPAAFSAAISPKTKAVIAVHLYGHAANLHAVCRIAEQHNIAVIEDCAQSQEATIDGRMTGSIGDIGCFSFYPTKTLGAIGDGGMLATRHKRFLDRIRQLRTYGWTKSQYAEIPLGRCSRLDELQAAFLTVKLRILADQIEARRKIAHRYRNAFSDLPLILPIEMPGYRHVYHLYVIRCDERDGLANHLGSLGISSGRHYPFPVHEQPGLARGARIPAPLLITEKLKEEILTLPLYPSMTLEQQNRTMEAVRAFFSRAGRVRKG